jgi:hypothetical protein
VFDVGLGILVNEHQTFSLSFEYGDVGSQQLIYNLRPLNCCFHWIFPSDAGDTDNLLLRAMESDVFVSQKDAQYVLDTSVGVDDELAGWLEQERALH